MTYVLLFVFLGQQIVADQWDADGDFDVASFDAAASKKREYAGVPGIAVAVLRNGQINHAKGERLSETLIRLSGA